MHVHIRNDGVGLDKTQKHKKGVIVTNTTEERVTFEEKEPHLLRRSRARPPVVEKAHSGEAGFAASLSLCLSLSLSLSRVLYFPLNPLCWILNPSSPALSICPRHCGGVLDQQDSLRERERERERGTERERQRRERGGGGGGGGGGGRGGVNC